MTYITYKNFSFKAETMDIIEKANEVIGAYQAQGYSLTLRQLYYQFVSRNWLENTERSYKRLGSIITDARLAGEISWSAINDEHRDSAHRPDANEDEREALYGIDSFISLDMWARQGKYVEVWVEKVALHSIVSNACIRYRVPNMACKGYLSATEAWLAGQRFKQARAEGLDCYLLHLGDHDPSGMDMTRDNAERVELFSHGAYVDVRRLALNMDQVQQYNPPPNPAKLTDSRGTGYVKKFGTKSWELDALEPKVIEQLIKSEIESLIDGKVWDATRNEEAEKREILVGLYDHWDDVRPFVQNLMDE